MAKATFDRFDLKDIETIKAGATRYAYASAGAADLAVEAVRAAVQDAQKRIGEAREAVQDLDFQPKALRKQAATAMGEGVDSLSELQAELQSTALGLPAKVQSLLAENAGTAAAAYADLAKRGEVLVARIRKQESVQETQAAAATTTAKAKTAVTQAKKATAKKAAPAAKKTATAAKKAAPAAKKTATKAAGKTAAAADSASTSPAVGSAKATSTAAKKTASAAARAVLDGAGKIGE